MNFIDIVFTLILIYAISLWYKALRETHELEDREGE
jgi:hypothetical protein